MASFPAVPWKSRPSRFGDAYAPEILMYTQTMGRNSSYYTSMAEREEARLAASDRDLCNLVATGPAL